MRGRMRLRRSLLFDYAVCPESASIGASAAGSRSERVGTDKTLKAAGLRAAWCGNGLGRTLSAGGAGARKRGRHTAAPFSLQDREQHCAPNPLEAGARSPGQKVETGAPWWKSHP